MDYIKAEKIIREFARPDRISADRILDLILMLMDPNETIKVAERIEKWEQERGKRE